MGFDSQTVFYMTAGIPKSEHNYKLQHYFKKCSVAQPMLWTDNSFTDASYSSCEIATVNKVLSP